MGLLVWVVGEITLWWGSRLGITGTGATALERLTWVTKGYQHVVVGGIRGPRVLVQQLQAVVLDPGNFFGHAARSIHHKGQGIGGQVEEAPEGCLTHLIQEPVACAGWE